MIYNRLIKYHTHDDIIKNMFYANEINKKNVFLFTILIGKKSNSEIIYDKISSYDFIKFCDLKKIQTGNNMRYILYWSFYSNYNEFIKEKLYSNDYNKFRPILKQY